MHVPLLLVVFLLAAVAGVSPFRALLHIGKGMLLGIVLCMALLLALYLFAH